MICPVEYQKLDDACKQYVDALNNPLGSDLREHMSKKWWIHNVVEMLLPLHQAYTNEFCGRQQTARWLAKNSTLHKASSRPIRRIGLIIRLGIGRPKRMKERMQQIKGKLLTLL
jgi:hypothetical protein